MESSGEVFKVTKAILVYGKNGNDTLFCEAKAYDSNFSFEFSVEKPQGTGYDFCESAFSLEPELI